MVIASSAKAVATAGAGLLDGMVLLLKVLCS